MAVRDGVLYRWGERLKGQGHVLQLLVPRQLQGQVLGLVHRHAGAGHFVAAKNLN